MNALTLAHDFARDFTIDYAAEAYAEDAEEGLTIDFNTHAAELTAHKVALAKAEGDLLIIAAHRHLGLNTDSDEDGFPYYVWEMADVARVTCPQYQIQGSVSNVGSFTLRIILSPARRKVLCSSLKG